MADLAALTARIARHAPREGKHDTALSRLWLIRASAPTQPMPVLYEPSVCVVVQGGKRALLGTLVYDYGAGQTLVASVDLAIVGSVTQASDAEPYLCLQLHLDVDVLSELALERPASVNSGPLYPGSAGLGLAINDASPSLLDAFARLLALLDAPEDARTLGPLVEREILYRLLMGPDAHLMRRIAVADGGLARVARAIAWIKEHFHEPFAVETLAALAGMSASTLHAQFKAATTMSPLQYRARLRLQEARRLMVAEGTEAAMAGFRVGYDSPSQFSREYRRLFGDAPAHDAARLRMATSTLEVA